MRKKERERRRYIKGSNGKLDKRKEDTEKKGSNSRDVILLSCYCSANKMRSAMFKGWDNFSFLDIKKGRYVPRQGNQ